MLASLDPRGLAPLVPPGRALFVPTAANGLPDRAVIIDAFRRPLVEMGWQLVDVDLDQAGEPPGADAAVDGSYDAVVCSGGNPFRLLAAIQRTGFGRTIQAVLDRGGSYLGLSAGAVVAGPSLEPMRQVSPFAWPSGLDPTGLGLTSTLVLPHDDRPNRRQLHAEAQRRHGRTHRLVGITDAELCVVGPGDAWRVLDPSTSCSIRPAVEGDAEGIATTYQDAAWASWSFIPTDRLTTLERPVERWQQRIAALEAADDLLVVEHDGRVAGFAWVHPADDPDLGPDTGELGSLYLTPSLWGGRVAARLQVLALDRLRARGCTTAVLYTEERNARPRRFYERSGWEMDGHVRSRPFVGTPLRELRYRLTL